MKETEIHAIGNEKGGVLKTTMTLHITDSCIKKNDLLTVVVDLDTQDSIRYFYEGSDPKNPKRNDYNVIGETVDLFNDDFEPKKQLEKGKANLLTGGKRLADKDYCTFTECVKAFNKLKSLGADVVLIDLPPTTSYKVLAAIAISTGIFIPTDFSALSQKGVDDVVGKINHVRKMKGLKSKVKPMGVIATLIDGRNQVQRSTMTGFLQKYGKKLIIPHMIKIRPSVRNGLDKHRLVWEIKGLTDAIPEYRKVVNEVIGRIIGNEEGEKA